MEDDIIGKEKLHGKTLVESLETCIREKLVLNIGKINHWDGRSR